MAPEDIEVQAGSEEIATSLEEKGAESTPAETPAVDPELLDRAKRMGYKEQGVYRGPADKFLSPDEYIRRSEEELPILKERNRYLDRQLKASGNRLERMEKTIQEMAEGHRENQQQKTLEKLHNLKEQRRDAVLRGDVEGEDRLDQEIFKLASTVKGGEKATSIKDTGTMPEGPQYSEEDVQTFETWTKQPEVASWYMKDREMTEEAVMIAELLARRGIGGQEQLDQVMGRLKRLYPEKFVTQKHETKAPANTKPAGGKETPGSSVADLPMGEYEKQRRREMGWDK